MKIGINLKEAAYIGSDSPFRNIAKTINTWIPQAWGKPVARPWNTGEEVLYLDEYNYPTRLPDGNEAIYTSLGTSFQHNTNGNYDSGVYRIVFNGEAELEFEYYPGSNNSQVLKHNYNPKNNRTIYLVDHEANNKGFYLSIADINPDNPISNLRIKFPNAPQTNNIFNKAFLDSLEYFDSIRYLEWNKTNANTEVKWGDRAHPKDVTFGGAYPDEGAVPWAYIINLSNVTQTNPWITIPHGANNNYVKNLATMFANRLDKDLTLTVEYSNEAWGMSVPRNYLIEYANQNFDYSTEQSVWDNFKVADASMKRSVEIINLFENTFDKFDADSERIIGTFSAQTNWTPYAERAFEFKFANPDFNSEAKPKYKPLLNQNLSSETLTDITGIDQISVGFYFGYHLGSRQHLHHWRGRDAVDKIFKTIFDGGVLEDKDKYVSSLDRSKQEITAFKAFIDEIGLPLVAYEGGQHLSTLGFRDQPTIDAFIAANRDPRMKEAYLEHYQNWQDIAGEDSLTMHWALTAPSSAVGWGTWGLEEYSGQARTEGLENTPKLDAILELTNQDFIF